MLMSIYSVRRDSAETPNIRSQHINWETLNKKPTRSEWRRPRLIKGASKCWPGVAFVAQAEVPPDQTYRRGRDILASNDLSSSGPLRGTQGLVDNLHREAQGQSQPPRNDIRRNSNFPFVLPSAETTRGESAAQIGYPSMNPPKETMDLLAKFGASSNTKTSEPRLSLARCQSGLKRTLAEGSNHDSLNARGNLIDRSTMGPVDKRGKTPLIQHQTEPLIGLNKSTPKRMKVFQKFAPVIEIEPNESIPKKRNPHHIALVNRYENRLKTKYLASNSQPEIDSPHQNLKQALWVAFESINFDIGNKIVLSFEDAGRVFARFSHGIHVDQPKDYRSNLIEKMMIGLCHNQKQWFKFWERRSGIDFEKELTGKISHPNDGKMLLCFLLHVDMIDTIIPPSKLVTTLKKHKENLFRDALQIFQVFKYSNPLYKNLINSEKQDGFMHHAPSLTWRCIYLWISTGERSDLKSLAFNTNGRNTIGFKVFFNIIFKLSNETAPRLRTLDLNLSIGRPSTRSSRDLNSDNPTSSRELRHAGQELRLNSVGQINSVAPIGYFSMKPPQKTMGLSAQFGVSSNTETTETHLAYDQCQSGLKRPIAEGSDHDSLKVRGKVIDCSTMGPVGKKAKTPLIQHQPEPLNNLQKSTPQRMGVFQKKLVSGIEIEPHESNLRKENPHHIALVNHYENRLKRKYLTSNSEPKIESLDFDLDTIVAEGASQDMKEVLRMAFQSSNLVVGNKIVLTFEDAKKVLARLPHRIHVDQSKDFSSGLIQKMMIELIKNQEQWFKFWERRSGINFEKELNGKVSHGRERKLLVSDLESLALRQGGSEDKSFKIFFNMIFKLTSGSLNDKLKPGPKLSQHL
ncbi:hypothetical protein PSTT_03977 [Puccinia striiformis]|uniref:Uncharacterized protein n=1 Tax=Puccinia striiformis TaxID=27350 RepID=A0A2S4VU40_9BASI|nr:hypothetical protein PSTT_03977 [Puccinia striiformis]